MEIEICKIVGFELNFQEIISIKKKNYLQNYFEIGLVVYFIK